MDKTCVINILKKSSDEISSHLKANSMNFNEILQNIVFRKELSGHNNQICIVDFLDNKGNNLGGVCLKYSSNKRTQFGLVTEINVLRLLFSNKIICPKIIDSGVLERNNAPYILMEIIEGDSINHCDLNTEKIRVILDLIKFHESILLNNVQSLNSPSLIENLHRKIDFEKKICTLLAKYVPSLNLENGLSFLNDYLNDSQTVRSRTIVTDRSVENIFQNRNGDIALIDFSTIRTGTRFDNWIQFIDDPRVNFTCQKEDLIGIFFERNKLDKKDIKLFLAASVYTNLLQGIFTYEKNSELGICYFKNANESFLRLENKRGMLISGY